jgi:hypothetical protein
MDWGGKRGDRRARRLSGWKRVRSVWRRGRMWSGRVRFGKLDRYEQFVEIVEERGMEGMTRTHGQIRSAANKDSLLPRLHELHDDFDQRVRLSRPRRSMDACDLYKRSARKIGYWVVCVCLAGEKGWERTLWLESELDSFPLGVVESRIVEGDRRGERYRWRRRETEDRAEEGDRWVGGERIDRRRTR